MSSLFIGTKGLTLLHPLSPLLLLLFSTAPSHLGPAAIGHDAQVRLRPGPAPCPRRHFHGPRNGQRPITLLNCTSICFLLGFLSFFTPLSLPGSSCCRPWLPTGMEAITSTTGIVLDLEVSKSTSALHNALGGAARHSTTSRACSSARNAARSASASLLATTATRASAPATTTGRPRRVAPSALERAYQQSSPRPPVNPSFISGYHPLWVGGSHISGTPYLLYTPSYLIPFPDFIANKSHLMAIIYVLLLHGVRATTISVLFIKLQCSSGLNSWFGMLNLFTRSPWKDICCECQRC